VLDMTINKEKSVRRLAFVLALAGLTLVALAAPAFAHVSLQPDVAVKGGFATVAFQVPNEQDAKTVKVEVQFPEDVAIPFVSTQPVDGWTVATTTRKLDTPLESEGESISEVTNTVTWTAASGGGIGAGEFQQFLLSMGQMPENVDMLEFPTIQTYDNGDEVSWVQETPASGEEPEFPAPTLTLEAGEGGHEGGEATTTTVATGHNNGGAVASASAIKTAQDDADNAKTIAIVGVVAGIIGILIGAIALVAGRKKTA
jgi:periplasmic copper chaperone A